MLAGVRAVLFDMGGTLAEFPLPEWPTVAVQMGVAACRALIGPESELPPAAELPGPAEASARRSPAGPGTAPAHRAVVGLRRVIRALSGRTLPRIGEACARPLLARGRLYEDALPVLRTLRRRGYRLGLVSNTPWAAPDYLWEHQMRRFGLDRLLEVRLFSSGAGVRKPDPRIFRRALEGLGCRPQEALFVGDSPLDDIAGARAVGMCGALLVRGGLRGGSAEGRGVEADLTIGSLADLLLHLPGPQNS